MKVLQSLAVSQTNEQKKIMIQFCKGGCLVKGWLIIITGSSPSLSLPFTTLVVEFYFLDPINAKSSLEIFSGT